MEEKNTSTSIIKKLQENFNRLQSLKDNGEFDEELAREIFQQEIDVTLKMSIETLYGLIESHHVSMAFRNFCDIKKPQTVREYYENVIMYNNGAKKLVGNKGKSTAFFVADKVSLDSKSMKDWFENCEQFASFLDDMVGFFGTAAFVSEKNGSGNSRAYYKNLIQNISAMCNSLNKASKKLECFNRGCEESIEQFHSIHRYFNDCAQMISKTLEQIMMVSTIDKKFREYLREDRVTGIDRSKVVVIEKDPKEIERHDTISQANMMYDELVSGTMRDLERQVPYSVREMYDYFVNVKFANFVKNFSMPLAETTKLNVAREAINQINMLNNYVTRISENATTTNIYMFKE